MNTMHPLKKTKKQSTRTLLRMAVLLPGLFLTAAVSAQITDTNGIIYTTNADNTLTVSGYTGAGGEVVIPGSVDGMAVAAIGTNAFENITNITSVAIPDGLTSIGDNAFDCCSSLAGVTIPGSVTNIGDLAFYYCPHLTRITIPGSVTSIGMGAFYTCFGLTNLTISNGVTRIGAYAFFACIALNQVAIPGSVTYISNGAFAGCDSLTNIVVDAQNQQYCTENGILFDISKTTLIQYPAGIRGSYVIPDGVTSIAGEAFGVSGFSGLTNITIPDSVTNIGDSAFSGCALTSVTIPNSVTSMGDGVFWCCSSLTSVIIPGSVTSIGKMTFAFCDSLNNVIIPNGVTSLGDGAFMWCGSLTNVTISATVTNIDAMAFSECLMLRSICFLGNAPVLPDDAGIFDDVRATVYYLAGTTGWGPTFDGLPTVALLVTTPPVIQGNQVTLNWTAMPGKTCHVEYRADLTSGDWTTVTNLTATQLYMSLTLPVTGQQGFYRIGMEP